MIGPRKRGFCVSERKSAITDTYIRLGSSLSSNCYSTKQIIRNKGNQRHTGANNKQDMNQDTHQFNYIEFMLCFLIVFHKKLLNSFRVDQTY